MIVGILSGIPIWVWPLFVGLLFLGFRATKQRQVPVFVVYLLPLLGLNALYAASKMDEPIIVYSVFVLGYLAGALLGYAKQANWLVSKENGRALVTGEWLTLATMMTIFAANFVAGMLKVINPDLYGNNGFIVVFVMLIAGSSGIFFGRALRVYRS